jgi:hypothetical protein
MTTALDGGEGSASRSGRSLPPGKTRYPLYRRLDGSQGRTGEVRRISPSPGFDPRTVQPVASRYTDYATRPTSWDVVCCYLIHSVRVAQKTASFSCRISYTLQMEADGFYESLVYINTISKRARIFRLSTVRTFDPKYL